jgi:ParB-like chromosome segregation protein Spo0J
VIEIKRLIWAASAATLLFGARAAFADNFIQAYGRGLVKYSEAVDAKGGNLTEAEHRKAYNEAFSEARAIHEKDAKNTRKRMGIVLRAIKEDLKAASEGKEVGFKAAPAKKASPAKAPEIAKKETPKAASEKARVPSLAAVKETGEFTKSGGAETIQFGNAPREEGGHDVAPLLGEKPGEAGGAQEVRFSE